MIEKKAGVYNVDSLRTILLFQPDFNFGNKVIGRMMMQQAELLHLMPEAQYGSRHGKSVSQQLLNKVLLFDLSRMQHKALGYCSTDAKSCCDRIVHSFAGLSLRRLGIPKEVVTTMLDVVKSMRHFISTGFGVSKVTYSHPYGDPFQGVGQGNGAGPAIWAAMSAPMLDYLSSRGRGVVFRSPLSRETIQVSGLAFVDDTDIVSGVPDDVSTLDDDVIHVLTDQVNDWAGALRVSGGAIVPGKSFYWILNYLYGKLGHGSRSQSIPSKDSAGNEGSKPCLSTRESRKTLGMLINPEGTWIDQRNKMRLLMEEWAESSRIANLSRQDAMVELKSRVFPKLLYGLEATSFHHRDCKYIMAPALKVGLNLCGTVRNLPRPVVFGPDYMLGLGLVDIYIAQRIRHLQTLVFFGPLDKSFTGQFIRCSMEEALVTVGLGRSVLSISYEDYGSLLGDCWVKTIWKFCWEYEVSVEDWLPSIPLLRENDQYIMAVAKKVLSAKDKSSLTSINKCRLFLKVVSLADIAFGSGWSLMETIRNGTPPRWIQRSGIDVVQRYPTAADWSVWRSFLSNIFPLRTVLGRWFSHVHVTCWLSAMEDFVYTHHHLGWMQHARISGSRSCRWTRYASLGPLVDEVPSGSLIAMVEVHSNGIYCWGGREQVPSSEVPTEVRECTWREVPFGVDRMSFSAVGPGSIVSLCSDGSYKDNRGTASWIATCGDLEIGGDLIVPDGAHCPYRSELAGILGGLRFLSTIPSVSSPREVRVICDGLSALQMAFGVLPLQLFTSHFDLLREIRACLRSILQTGVQVVPVHVAGHADDRSEIGPLSLEETLNIRMDTRAKAFWSTMNIRGWPHSPLPGSCVVTWQESAVEVKDLGVRISEGQLKAYWLKLKGVPISSQVDWQSFSKATRLVRRGKGVFLTKFFSGICGVNHWRRRWGLVTSDLCTRCNLSTETTAHLWDCLDSDAVTLRQKQVDDLIQWIVNQGGNSRFCQTMRSVLGAYQSGSTLSIRAFPSEFRDVVAAQQVIGWDHFLMGLWSRQWIAQLKAERSRSKWIFRVPERATAAIIVKLWEIAWNLWLGRNSAIYPSEEINAEGELTARTFSNFGLCRRRRRTTTVGEAGSRQIMRNWLNSRVT